MKFIAHKRCKEKLICGEMNLPAGTSCDGAIDGVIRLEDKVLCYASSDTGHKYFCRDDDGCGMLRGRLTSDIQKKLQKRDGEYQIRWDRIWADTVCQKYKRKEYQDYWLWNDEFFQADIDDLKHIAKLLNIKET